MKGRERIVKAGGENMTVKGHNRRKVKAPCEGDVNGGQGGEVENVWRKCTWEGRQGLTFLKEGERAKSRK